MDPYWQYRSQSVKESCLFSEMHLLNLERDLLAFFLDLLRLLFLEQTHLCISIRQVYRLICTSLLLKNVLLILQALALFIMLDF